MNEFSKLKATGDSIVDIIHYKDGRVEEIDRGHNLVVNSLLPLLQCLLKNDSSYKGIQYWAVGSGSDSWDDSAVSPQLTETTLTKEIGRKSITADNIKFMDSGFNETQTPTNIIEITATFGANECNGEWREFGLFGGEATSALNSGTMINKKHHAVLTKTSDMVIERRIRLTLNF